MKRLISGILLMLALAARAGGGTAVSIPAEGLELKAVVYRPEGTGPFPAIVLLHGCSGLWGRNGEPTASYDFWARHFQAGGYVALLLDSFGPRGEREICTQQRRGIRATHERVADAWAALRWAVRDPAIDPLAVFVMGWSNGGTTVLNAIARAPAAGEPGFRAAVAFYPGCGALAKSTGYRPAAPVLIQAGGADDWTPAGDCRHLASRLPEGAPAMDIDVYPDAHHAFDRVEGRVRHRPEVRNPSSPTGRGATVGPHPEARSRALERTTRYLQEALESVPRGTNPRAIPALP